MTKDTRSSQWNAIVELLTLSQLEKIMGDGFRTYESKASQAKRVSRSKRVHALADGLIETCKNLRATTTYFQGFALPRTEQIRDLISQHVVAVQEYNHAKADAIETTLFEIHRALSQPTKAV